ncbi:DUF2326 domain-containing protein [Acanthopleuribacter pedis]|uniref:DUF2326 domain-containing protein n=1 Tax=Acanthopleuribacter pedis TaxID=442870 RepID=A0A8J7QCJ4_9BACT|nr:DUF2326 domain-containing protein [Acanthopleuribacter pedis]MBO1318491.1 DUF2326 domain-containing protein [Acanthopleuribacter pedis]
MKLSKLYTNQPTFFEPILFESGLNVVLAEIRLPENKKKDTHNLGKTTLGRILDFCFLSKKQNNFFLFKHINVFKGFIFFLEVELPSGTYLTVSRSVENSSKIRFKKHHQCHQDFNLLPDNAWDHRDLPFERAQKMMDGLLDWQAIKPWPFRNILGYQLRTQDDFQEVFHLNKFKGKHIHWKPFLAFLLGFDASLIEKHYQLEEQCKKLEAEEKTINKQLSGTAEELSKIQGMLLIKKDEAKKKQERLDQFNFHNQDLERTEQLVHDLDEEISELNARRYSLKLNQKKIQKSLDEESSLFDTKQASILFQQAGVFFDGQIKRDFDQLVEFNKAITDERQAYLTEEHKQILEEINNLNETLKDLNQKRSLTLSFIKDSDVFNKYRILSDELVELRSDITFFEKQQQHLQELKNYRESIREINNQIEEVRSKIEEDVEKHNQDETSLFSSIRLYFNEIVQAVISRQAVLSVAINRLGHLEFDVAILDQSGNSTSADLGHTYRKLLCIAFDLAILRAHDQTTFPRFVFHDGVFESLDDRKKTNLLKVLRDYVKTGIQPIITLIDSDLPPATRKTAIFDPEDIILTLHDEGDAGRLFKMKAW